MNTPSPFVAAAHAIVPHLSGLLGPEAGVVNPQLQALLSRYQNGEPVESEMMELLKKNEPTRQWMNQRLNAEAVTTRGGDTLGYFALAGNREGVKGAKYYRCPRTGFDYRWTQVKAWQIPPQCPEHGCDLIVDE